MSGSERTWPWLFTNLEGLMEYRNEHPLGQAPKAEGEGCQFACVCACSCWGPCVTCGGQPLAPRVKEVWNRTGFDRELDTHLSPA